MTDETAAISLLNALFQLAVLSIIINTLGKSAVVGVAPTNKSVSSAIANRDDVNKANTSKFLNNVDLIAFS